MQLPRGTFRYIKKDMKLEGILEELQLSKFSGICTISSGSAQGTLVFKSGKRILAEFRNVAGDAAWDEFQKIAGEKVDASVSTMDDTQIELSLEFNKSCRIGKGGKLEPSSLSSAKTDSCNDKKIPSGITGRCICSACQKAFRNRIFRKSLHCARQLLLKPCIYRTHPGYQEIYFPRLQIINLL